MIDPRSVVGRVGQQQIQGRRGNARVGVIEMPIADQHHPQHDGEVGDDGRGALDRVVRFDGEDVKQGIARPPQLEDLAIVSTFSLTWGLSPDLAGIARRPIRVAGGAMTFDIRKTNIEAQANVKPLAERLGSRSGRRTMAESTSIRKRKNQPTDEEP